MRIMKSSTNKTIVVRLTAGDVSEYDVDTEIFEDPFMEAATRAVEKARLKKHGIIRPVTECWEKKNPKQAGLYNSYWILVNAACYAKAELLREKFRMQTDCDLAKEPIRGNSKSKSR